MQYYPYIMDRRRRACVAWGRSGCNRNRRDRVPAPRPTRRFRRAPPRLAGRPRGCKEHLRPSRVLAGHCLQTREWVQAGSRCQVDGIKRDVHAKQSKHINPVLPAWLHRIGATSQGVVSGYRVRNGYAQRQGLQYRRVHKRVHIFGFKPRIYRIYPMSIGSGIVTPPQDTWDGS